MCACVCALVYLCVSNFFFLTYRAIMINSLANVRKQIPPAVIGGGVFAFDVAVKGTPVD